MHEGKRHVADFFWVKEMETGKMKPKGAVGFISEETQESGTGGGRRGSCLKKGTVGLFGCQKSLEVTDYGSFVAT